MHVSWVTDIPRVPALASHDKLGFSNISTFHSTNAEKCPRCTPTEKWLFLSLKDPQGVRSINSSEQLLCSADTLCHLRRMNWGEDLLFNRINVKLKCTVFILSNIFSLSDIFNFETNLFPIVPPAKINSCKSFNPK